MKKTPKNISKRRTVAAPKPRARGGSGFLGPFTGTERRRQDKFIRQMIKRAESASPHERAQAEKELALIEETIDGERRRAGMRTVFGP